MPSICAATASVSGRLGLNRNMMAQLRLKLRGAPVKAALGAAQGHGHSLSQIEAEDSA